MQTKDIENKVDTLIQETMGHLSFYELKQVCEYGLAEEAGEVLGVLKRRIRGFSRDKEPGDFYDRLIEELGDTLWYLTAICVLYGLTLDGIWEDNCRKMEKRYGQNK